MSAVPSPHSLAVPARLWAGLARKRDAPRLPSGLDAGWHTLRGLARRMRVRSGVFLDLADGVLAREREATALSEGEALDRIAQLREAFRRRSETTSDLLLALALVREQARFAMGQHPYRVQIAGALAMHHHCLAEMATGEGKTLTASLAATLAGWRGEGCHVITVNDYLAKRDAAWMQRVYERCGLRAASIAQSDTPDARKLAYAADITYATNKEVAADYLRDHLALRGINTVASLITRGFARGEGLTRRDDPTDHLVMRGLAHAIVDEADSILIDEAVTPLIIAGRGPLGPEHAVYALAHTLAQALCEGEHYTVDQRHREVALLPAGSQAVSLAWADRASDPMISPTLRGLLAGARRRDELITQALTARELFHLGRQYVIKNDDADTTGDPRRVVIVDEFTGRLMPDRQWRDGLHEAVCAKEGLPVAPPQRSLARVSFQRFFRMYQSLAGMSGTAREERRELWATYNLTVSLVPRNKPRVARTLPTRCYPTLASKLDAILVEVRTLHATGRPILIGTRSVALSQQVSSLLASDGLAHEVLSALHHEEESSIIARAGQRGSITVATNMAGRGTDIRLGEGVAALGGLHVIATELHESARIDRQLLGRAGRQGDPGSGRVVFSLQDELVQRFAGPIARALARSLPQRGSSGPRVNALARSVQRAAQTHARAQRAGVLKQDEWLSDALSFAGVELGLARPD